MSRVRNSVYGLALGDAIAYRTEFDSFQTIVKKYRDEDIRELTGELLVSDDTQMSLYLLKGFIEAYDKTKPVEAQKVKITKSVANNFLLFYNDPRNGRAPGIACMKALEVLENHLNSYPQGLFSRKPKKVQDYLVGGKINYNSKGSGTVMRSPWIGLIHGKKIISDNMLEKFCNTQSAMTHQHPTALHASYLTALITSSLYTSSLRIGELVNFAECFCASQESDIGWRDLSKALAKVEKLPYDFAFKEAHEYDPSLYLGCAGTAEDVLVTALVLIDTFGHHPLEVLKRSMFTGGDSDTIGAVAGGILGAAYEHDIWKDVEHLLESQYIPELNEAVKQLSSVEITV